MQQDEEEDFFYRPQRVQGQRLDPAITRMVLAAGGLSLVVIAIAFVWSGFHAGNFGPPPVINPPAVPLRVAPQSPGGLVVPEANVPIMSGEGNSTAAPQLAPQSQAPNLAELDQDAGLNKPPPSPPPAPALPAAAPAAAPASAGPAQVQLAAMADEGGAEAAWTAAQQKAPALLAGKTPVILPAVINGASVWRVRLGGFASAAAAQAFCTELIAKGAACLVAGP